MIKGKIRVNQCIMYLVNWHQYVVICLFNNIRMPHKLEEKLLGWFAYHGDRNETHRHFFCSPGLLWVSADQ